MRKTMIVLIAILLFIVSGCSNKKVIKHNYTYKGENEFWKAEYKVNDTSGFIKKDSERNCENNSNTTLTITYKKDLSELSSVKHLEISYKSSAKSGKLDLHFNNNPPDEKIYTLKSNSTEGAIESKDEVVKVSINVDGKTQIIELK